MEPNDQRLSEFIRSADLLLSDIELEDSRNQLEILFDNADVRRAVLGMDAFYDASGTLLKKEFDDRRTLVQSLAAAGWLGSFGMVAPHQAEFATFVSQQGSTRRRHESGERQKQSLQFWRDVGVLRDPGDEIEALRDLSDKQISEIVKKQVGAAERFFKAVHCISGAWQSRLREWVARRRLLLALSAEDFASVVSGDAFRQFKSGFDNARPEHPVNNFADAAALAIILRKTNEFRIGRSSKFPCFFARPLFHQVVNGSEYKEQFTVALPSGIPTSSLRDSDYFLLRAIFRPAVSRLSGTDRKIEAKGQDRFTPQALRDLRRRIHEILEAQTPLPPEAVKKLEFFGHSVVSIIRELEQLSFFERVWLPSTAERDTKVALRRLNTSVRLLESAKFRRGVRAAVERVERELNSNVEGYRVVRRLYDQLLPRYRDLRSQVELKTETTEEVIGKLGLIRFSFRPESQLRIAQTVHALFDSEQETEATTLLQVIRAYWNARENIRAASEDAETAAGILWTADLDELIIRIAETRRIQHFSLDLVFAAATIRSGTHLPSGIERMRDLENRYSGPRMDRRKGDLAVGLGYLYHRLWARSLTTAQLTQVRRLLKVNHDGLIKRAVDLAADATRLLRDGDQVKRVYAVNQHVFYLVLRPLTDLREMTYAADELMTFQNKPDVWQYRFDDTLARYFLRLANTARTDSDFTRFLTRATELADLAHQAAKLDRDVLQTLQLIDNSRNRGGPSKRGRAAAARSSRVREAPPIPRR